MTSLKEHANLRDRFSAVEKELQSLTTVAREDEETRKMLLAVSRQTVNACESGPDVIWRISIQPQQHASLRAALEMGLIQALIEDGPKNAIQLAKATGTDKLLVVRILRPLAAMKVIEETAYETYSAGPVAQAFALPELNGMFKFMFDGAALSCAKLPEFLVQNEFKNPDNPQGAFQYSHKSSLQMYEWLQHHPSQLSNFNNFMGGQRRNRVDWFDSFPVEEILIRGSHADSEGVLLIDIAGGRGHDIQGFVRRFPDASGKLVLQDLPAVIDEITDLDERILQMKYDFFTPQPIKGARAYYYRSIFHNWPDHKCRAILQKVVQAMTPGYSKLLINEWVLPDTNVPLYPATLDILMMVMLSGIERTETQWKELLSSVGLKIVKFWSIGPEDEGLIEAVLET